MRNIAAEAGVTEPAIYRHFASRADLLGAVFLQCAGALYDSLAEAAAGTLSPRAQLSLMAGAFFDFAFRRPDEYAFIVAVHQQQLRHLEPGEVRLPQGPVRGGRPASAEAQGWRRGAALAGRRCDGRHRAGRCVVCDDGAYQGLA